MLWFYHLLYPAFCGFRWREIIQRIWEYSIFIHNKQSFCGASKTSVYRCYNIWYRNYWGRHSWDQTQNWKQIHNLRLSKHTSKLAWFIFERDRCGAMGQTRESIWFMSDYSGTRDLHATLSWQQLHLNWPSTGPRKANLPPVILCTESEDCERFAQNAVALVMSNSV